MGTIATQPLWLRVAVFRVSQNIWDLHGSALKKNSPSEAASPRRNREGLVKFNVLGREAVTCRNVMPRLFRRVANLGHISLAKLGGGLYQRVQHGLEIESRTTDDLEHVGSCGLLLQGFAQCMEQPRVLDGDDGLVSEACHQFHLSIGEGTHLIAIDDESANQSVAPDHGHTKEGSYSAKIDAGAAQRVTCAICRLRADI